VFDTWSALKIHQKEHTGAEKVPRRHDLSKGNSFHLFIGLFRTTYVACRFHWVKLSDETKFIPSMLIPTFKFTNYKNTNNFEFPKNLINLAFCFL
jgi:hypothetical protein